MDAYFIVLDKAKIEGHGPEYHLMFGDPDEAVGTFQAKSPTIKALLALPSTTGETVYRTYLQRTDGKTGKKLLRQESLMS